MPGSFLARDAPANELPLTDQKKDSGNRRQGGGGWGTPLKKRSAARIKSEGSKAASLAGRAANPKFSKEQLTGNASGHPWMGSLVNPLRELFPSRSPTRWWEIFRTAIRTVTESWLHLYVRSRSRCKEKIQNSSLIKPAREDR